MLRMTLAADSDKRYQQKPGATITAAPNYLTQTPNDAEVAALLQDLWIVGVDYGRCTLRAPWAIKLPSQLPTRLHHVVAGHAWLIRAGEPSIRFEAGSSFLIAHGGQHVIASDDAGPSTPLDAIPMQLVGNEVYDVDFGGDGETSLLVCCSIDIGDTTTGLFLESLPDLVVAEPTSKASRFNALLVEAMAEEFQTRRPASATILARLADLIIAAMLRDWIEGNTGPQPGWLAGMRDPQLGKALAAMHRQPGEDWNVQRLAELAGMSRSNFARRFAHLIGRTPARFLIELRMRAARRLLAEQQLNIGEIGLRLGYASEAAFSRAFKRVEGEAPIVVRRSKARKPA